jgi:hypothetical protein
MEQRDFKSWPPGRRGRPRLLIEDSDPALRIADFHRFVEAGVDVALCSGPDKGEGCPLVEVGDCALAASADVVLMGREVGESREAIASAHRRHHPDVPVIAKVARQGTGTVPEGCVPLPVPISVDGEIRAVWRAVERADAPRVTPAPAPPCSLAESATEARLLDLLGW